MIYKNVNGTQKLVTNIRKPKKWRRFEYLESTGTQWIDTNFTLNAETKIMLDFQYVTNRTSSRICGGTITNCELWWSTDNKFHFYANTGSNINTSITANFNRHTFIYDNPNLKAYIDNTAFTFNTRVTNPGFTLFKANNGSYNKAAAKIYECVIYINSNEVMHLIPCQYNGQYGMWDLVENKFYGNKGTGTFTVGPEIGKPYDEVEKLIIPSKLLPSGVELYDYIENDGNQWINTGIIANSSTKVETKFQSSVISPISVYSSQTGSADGFRLFWYNNILYAASGGYRASTSMTPTTSAIYTTIHSYNTLTINNTSYSTASGNVFGNNLLLMRDPYSDSYRFNGKFYYCKIYNGDSLIRNLIPCTYFGEPGMWDTVTKQFYRNQGTGSFTLGNKIQLIQFEYLQTNTGSQYIVTGISLTDGHWIAYDMIFRYEPNGIRRLMGTNGASSAYFGAHTNNTYSKNVQGSSQAIGNIDHMYDEINLYDSYKITCKVNDIQYHQTNIKASNSEGPVNIFTLRTGNGGAGQQFYSGKIIYDGNIVRDFIPCTCNGTPGLWDKVELKFYGNAGSGTFTLGRQLSGEIPIWVQKNALIKSSSNGTYDYIDTGINNYTMNNIRCICEMTPLNGEDNAFFGSRGSYYLFYKVSDNYFWPTSKCETIQGTLVVGHKYLVDWNKGTLTVTGDDGVYQKGVRSSTANNTQNLYIFTFNPKDTRTKEAKIHWFKIYIDDVLVRDFVPATMGGRPGLYDKINHKMYFNANSSGNFTVE